MAEPGKHDPAFHFRLFVSGSTPRSLRAIAVIRDVCDKTVPGRYWLEVVDIYDNPAAAQAEQVVAVPTLVMKLPLPRRLFVGDMSDTTRLLTALGAALDLLEKDDA
jgi:circadian clock protein KaiB